MTFSKLATLFVVPLCFGTAALAAEAEPVSLSRAEVLADLQIWQQSGMADLHAGDEQPPFFKSGYDAAAARYTAMRTSPTFAALVDRIARQRGEAVRIAATN